MEKIIQKSKKKENKKNTYEGNRFEENENVEIIDPSC